MKINQVQSDVVNKEVTQEHVAEDFDRYSIDYEDKVNDAISFGGLEHSFYIDVKRNEILRQASIKFKDLKKLNVLDLGCGIGAYHAGLEGKFNQLHGIDVSKQSVDYAKNNNNHVLYESYDGDSLPYPDNHFDLVFSICVMHHVPPANWGNFIKEIHRTLKSGGVALIFEHNPYNPATQYIVRTCEIDKDAVLLAPRYMRKLFNQTGFGGIYTRTIFTILPIGKILSYIDRGLGCLPFGAQYYLNATKI